MLLIILKAKLESFKKGSILMEQKLMSYQGMSLLLSELRNKMLLCVYARAYYCRLLHEIIAQNH